MKSFKQYISNKQRLDEVSNVTSTFKLGQSKKTKEEFRRALEEISGAVIPERIKWTNPAAFTAEFNKLISRYKKEMEKMYHIWAKGTGGPGEMLVAYLCDDVLLSDKANIDLKTPSGYIEMKALASMGEKGFYGYFVLGAKYAAIESELKKNVDKLIEYINAVDPGKISDRDLVAISKGNLNYGTVKVLEEYNNIDVEKTYYEFLVKKSKDVFYGDKKIGKIDDEKTIDDILTIIQDAKGLKTFNEYMEEASQGFEKVSTPFFFIKPPDKKGGLKLQYFDKLRNIRLKNSDQNGYKYYMIP